MPLRYTFRRINYKLNYLTKDDQYKEKKMQVNEGITFEWKIWNNFSKSIKAWSGKKKIIPDHHSF